jgi:2-polyprenyl-3-methyl-5-hydroxy-6-metoxy-1,4-benzoquinol methylase
MTHHDTGVHKILDRPGVYERVQRLLGARAARRRLATEFLRPFAGARLLDVGCGTGSLLDSLPEEVDYVGFDLNPAYIEAAQKKYSHRRARFYCARAGVGAEGLEERTFDLVVAKSLLHHLDDSEAHQLLETARRLLRAGGAFFSSDPVRHEGQALVAKVLLALDRGRSIRTPDAYRALASAHFATIETTLLTDLLPIPYSHFVMRATAV